MTYDRHELVAWTPRTRAERNAARRWLRWRIRRLDRRDGALLMPVTPDGKDIPEGRLWVPLAQVCAGALAVRLYATTINHAAPRG
jgi:hypothetical protein